MKFSDFLIEQQGRQYLHWQVIARANTRAVSYARRDMIRSLEWAGAEVTQAPKGGFGRQILDVKRYIEDDEDPREVRKEVDRAIRVIHPRAGRKFLGLKTEE